MSVPLHFFFSGVRDKKLELNNKNILDSVVLIRSSTNSRMLDSQSKSNLDTKTGYTFNKTVASVQLGTSLFIYQNKDQ